MVLVFSFGYEHATALLWRGFEVPVHAVVLGAGVRDGVHVRRDGYRL